MITFVISAALVVCLVMAATLGRTIGLDEFASNRRRSTLSQLFMTNLATFLGGWMIFGLNAIGHTAGVLGWILGASYAFGVILLSLIVPRIKEAMEQNHCDTLDDFIGATYGTTAQLLSSLLNTIFFTGILAAQFIAMASFLSVFSAYESGALLYVAAATVVFYTAAAGFRGVLFTDSWQLLIVSISTLLIFVFLSLQVEWSDIWTLPEKHFTGTAFGLGPLIAFVIIFPLSILVRSDLWQRIASARDVGTARTAFLLTAPLLLLFYIVLTTLGVFGRIGEGADAQADISAYVFFLNTGNLHISSPIFTGMIAIISLGIFGALLSTADTNLNLVSVSISRLLRREDWLSQATLEGSKSTAMEKSLLTHVRATTIAIGALAFLIALNAPNIVNLIVGAAAAVTVFIVPVVAALFFGSRNRNAAIASLASGILVLVPSLLMVPLIAMIPASITAAIVFIAVAGLTPRAGKI